MLTDVVHHMLYRRRVRAARAWSDAARREAAEHDAAVQRILGQLAEPPRDNR